MTDSRKSGIAFLAGSLGGLVTMAVHPVGHASLDPQMLVVGSALAHALAMVSSVCLFLGACGLAQRLRAPDRLAFAGLVVYGLAAIAILIATGVSGFIVPELIERIQRDVPEAGAMWRIAIVSVFQINQGFAKIYTVAGSVALALWSWAALRRGGLSRGLATYGLVLAPVLTALIVSGHLRLDVHGMLLVVFTQAIWFCLAAAELLRAEPAAGHEVAEGAGAG